MKKVILSLLVLCFGFIQAQDKIFVHTATASNIHPTLNHITLIDHPDLNGNPNAGIVFSHVFNPNGGSGVYNDNIDGLFYTYTYGKWAIYNEDLSPMEVGASFFVYIASDPSDVITHVASVANEHPWGNATTVLDPTFFGNNPGPYAVMSNYFNPHSVYNPYNYAFLYDYTVTNTRNIYNQAFGTPIPTNAAFKILVNGSGVVDHYTHQATASNTSAHITTIDHPDLNNNPNAAFVFSYYSGLGGVPEVEIDKKISAYYNGTKWKLYTEDQSPFPIDVNFDIIIANREVLSAEEVDVNPVLAVFPNPADDMVKVSTNTPLKEISVYNILGQEVKSVQVDTNLSTVEIPITELTPGTYMVNVLTQSGQKQTLKLLKE
jgi:hypothetical protein